MVYGDECRIQWPLYRLLKNWMRLEWLIGWFFTRKGWRYILRREDGKRECIFMLKEGVDGRSQVLETYKGKECCKRSKQQ